MIDLLEHARRLAQRGLPVFPCNIDKRPVTRSGWCDATTDLEVVEGWIWDEDRLIGVPTGTISGISVLDIDPRHGGDRFLAANESRLQTRRHWTRSGGLHLLYRAREGLRNSAGQIAPGVDVRGDGGYIIWWPAHECEVTQFLPLRKLPDWPEWLVPAPRKRKVANDLPRRSALDEIDQPRHRQVLADRRRIGGLVDFVRSSREGERNNRLFWAACRLVETEFVTDGQALLAVDQLLSAAIATGLDRAEAQRTIDSALRHGGR